VRATKTSWVKRAISLAGFLLIACAQTHGQAPGVNALPSGDGKDVIAKACTQCHSLGLTVAMRNGRVGWQEMVDNMILRGAQVRPDEEKITIDYLVENFGPGKGPMASPKGAVLTLAEGPGKAAVESHCTYCHDAGRITDVKRSKNEWEATVKQMTHWRGVAVTPEEIQTMTTYLSAQYGGKAE
jgi:cytochrome c5